MTGLDLSMEARTVLEGPFATEVTVRGDGPPVVFFHTQYGLRWTPYLDALAKSFTVYAPRVAAEEATLERLDDMLDLLTYTSDILDALGLDRAHLVGHSLGAALAAEVAAITPRRVDKLVLLSPLGIWSDSDPVPDLVGETPATRVARLYADPDSEDAQEWLSGLRSTDRIYLTGMRGYSHWYWPLPDAGLHKRAHRVSAPTLVVHGDEDGLTTCRYADTLAGLISGARVEHVVGASHLLSERADEVAQLTTAHLQG